MQCGNVYAKAGVTGICALILALMGTGAWGAEVDRLVSGLHAQIVAGTYDGRTPRGNACRVRITEIDSHPARSPRFDPRTGLDQRHVPCTRLRSLLSGGAACWESFDPGVEERAIRFVVEETRESWIDRADVLASTRTRLELSNGTRRVIKGSAAIDGPEGKGRRFILRVVQIDPRDPTYFSRRQIRGAVASSGRPVWIEIARKDSASLRDRYPMLESRQNLIRCESLEPR